MEILGYVAAVFIGVSLGLIGGGGSILTVPTLVYLFGRPASVATTYSLFIVGLTALIGAVPYMRQKLVDFRISLAFGLPAVIGVLVTRRLVVPRIPDQLFTVGSLDITKDKGLLFVFAVLMVAASYAMIRPAKTEVEGQQVSASQWQLTLKGFMVGTITALVGAGGGFLIIPALVVLAKLPMKSAVGTSLIIIATNSLIGFATSIRPEVKLEWNLLGQISVLAIGGVFVGAYVSKFVSGAKLKPGFGYFVLVMGTYIIAKELFFS